MSLGLWRRGGCCLFVFRDIVRGQSHSSKEGPSIVVQTGLGRGKTSDSRTLGEKANTSSLYLNFFNGSSAPGESPEA